MDIGAVFDPKLPFAQFRNCTSLHINLGKTNGNCKRSFAKLI